MTLTSNLFLAAESVVIDETTKSVSIFNIIEEMAPEALPFFVQRFAICCFCLRENLQVESRQDLILKIANNNRVLFEHSVRVDFQNKLRNRVVISINGLQIPEAGKLTFQMFNRGHLLNQYEVTVSLRSEIANITIS